jgi:SAM-dependent methyltransferase
MSTNPPSDQTVAYYDAHAVRYARYTLPACMGTLYDQFLALVPPGGHILDAGSGSGRASLEFKRRGYKVTAVDASRELARLASEVIGQAVGVLRFQELTFEEAFDGIWACASLLHVSRGVLAFRHSAEIRETLRKDGWTLEEGPTLWFSAEHARARDGATARRRLHRLGLLTSGDLRIEFCEEASRR